MSMCNSAMEYFALDEMDAAEVIEYICLMQAAGRRVENKADIPDTPRRKETVRRVYADQANWY